MIITHILLVLGVRPADVLQEYQMCADDDLALRTPETRYVNMSTIQLGRGGGGGGGEGGRGGVIIRSC